MARRQVSDIRFNNTVGRKDAEIARLLAVATEMKDEADSLRAENERLRAALRQIADEEDIFNYGHTLPVIARTALNR